jgi:hypothetical protein
MMADMHPDEIQLLDYVEDESADPELSRHLEACPACREQVRRLEVTRTVLRATPLLDLPAARRAEIASGLPARRARRFRLSLGRAVAVLTPVAAAALVAVVIVTGEFGGQEEGAPEGGGAEAVAGETLDRAADQGAEQAVPSSAPVATVEGPPREVALFLRNRGFDARARDGSVVVLRADATQVARALSERRTGGVTVFVQP